MKSKSRVFDKKDEETNLTNTAKLYVQINWERIRRKYFLFEKLLKFSE